MLPKFEDLKSKILQEIIIHYDEDYIIFVCNDNNRYKLWHYLDCCENVNIKEIVGDINDLLNTPILLVEETKQYSDDKENDSFTWTFYKLVTIKGAVTISWYGESTGYYSEEVDFELISELMSNNATNILAQTGDISK